MRVLPPNSDIEKYLAKHNLKRKFAKQRKLLEENIFHPGLHVELLEPRNLRIFSFRIDRKYRAIFIFPEREVVEIVDINNHYQ